MNKQSSKYYLDLDDIDMNSSFRNFKNHEEWGNYHYNKGNDKEGNTMASAIDFYNLLKEDDNIIKRLKSEFLNVNLVTSTRVFYWCRNLNAEIAHYGLPTKTLLGRYTNIMPIFSKSVEAPHYPTSKLDDILEDEKGLKFIQTLFNTEDKKEEIIQTLTLTTKDNKIVGTYVSTPPHASRCVSSDHLINNKRSVSIRIGNNLHIDCMDFPKISSGISIGIKS